MPAAPPACAVGAFPARAAARPRVTRRRLRLTLALRRLRRPRGPRSTPAFRVSHTARASRRCRSPARAAPHLGNARSAPALPPPPPPPSPHSPLPPLARRTYTTQPPPRFTRAGPRGGADRAAPTATAPLPSRRRGLICAHWVVLSGGSAGGAGSGRHAEAVALAPRGRCPLPPAPARARAREAGVGGSRGGLVQGEGGLRGASTRRGAVCLGRSAGKRGGGGR